MYGEKETNLGATGARGGEWGRKVNTVDYSDKSWKARRH